MEGIAVVFGGNRGAGAAVVRALAARGNRVRAVSRSGRGSFPPGVEVVRGDATDPASTREACQGASTVYHCANVPYPEWFATLPRLMAGVIAGAAAAGAVVVYADNLYMYGRPSGPLREDSPIRPADQKGELRQRLAEQLLDAHRAGTVRAAIARGSDFYGPGVENSVPHLFVFPAVLARRTARWVGRLDVVHSLTAIDDFARAMLILGDRAEAYAEVWHIPAAEALTGRGFIQLVSEVAGVRPRVGVIGHQLMRVGGLFSPLIREAERSLYQFEAPWVIDGSKFVRSFGDLPPTEHRAAIRATLAWLRAQQPTVA